MIHILLPPLFQSSNLLGQPPEQFSIPHTPFNMSEVPAAASPVTTALLDTRAMPQFTYQPLHPDQLRILILAPGKKDDALTGKLMVKNMNHTLKYDALSYMWGDPTPAGTIYLSGKALPIASNLNTALQHLRYENKPLVIWIDAICVNQEDLAERATQVHYMRRIFNRAHTVRIWIHEPDIDGFSEAIAALQNFHLAEDDLDLGQARLGENPVFWDPVAPIFTNDYWSRAWVGVIALITV